MKKNDPLDAVLGVKSTIFIVILMTLQTCFPSRPTTIDSLKGHWHMDTPYSLTLDITDSVVQVNKYSFRNDERYEFQLFDSTDNAITLPIICGCGGTMLPVVRNFTISKDTLRYDNGISVTCYAITPICFLKSDPENCKWSHILSGISPTVRLASFPERTSTIVNVDSLRQQNIVVFLDIGPPLNKAQFGDYPRIQAADVFITLDEIPEFIHHEKMRYDEHKAVVLCLNIDKSVSSSFVQEVVHAIPTDSISGIYRLVSSESEIKLGYEKI
jgi:hypothetical protein